MALVSLAPPSIPILRSKADSPTSSLAGLSNSVSFTVIHRRLRLSRAVKKALLRFEVATDYRRDSRRRRADYVIARCSLGLKGIGRGVALEGTEKELGISERAKVVALVAFVMALCNADRVVMSVAVVPLAAKYGWSSSFIGIVQSSFLWGYLASSLAGGVLADRYGGKRVMAWGAAIWSMATLLTPWAADHSTLSLFAMRTFFGLAEGVALPSMNTLLSRWFPAHERASAVGISMAGFHLGNAMSLLATPVFIANVGVNGSFMDFAALGFLWLSLWTSTVTNHPRDNPMISAVELRLITAGKVDDCNVIGQQTLPTVRHLMSKFPTWAIILANVANNWGYFVLLSWMPVYFKTVYNVNLKQAAWFSALPWGVMALSGCIAGASSDFLIKSGQPVTRVRKIMQSIGFMGPGLALFGLKYAQSPSVAALLLTVSLSLSSFSQAGFLLNMQDIAPKCAGFLHGFTNSAGTVAAIISTVGTGYFVEWLGSFQAFLTVTSIIYFSATLFWIRYATADQVFF